MGLVEAVSEMVVILEEILVVVILVMVKEVVGEMEPRKTVGIKTGGGGVRGGDDWW